MSVPSGVSGLLKDKRIAAPEDALLEALRHWRYPPLTAEEKARRDEIWALVHSAPLP